MKPQASLALVLATSALAALAAGCRGQPSEDPPVLLIRNMYDQPKYRAQSPSDFFADGRTMRQPPEGTVARETYLENQEVATGYAQGTGSYVMTIPTEVVQRGGGMDALLARGQERFNIYCTPCHDQAGTGNGAVVTKGFQKPPSLHDARIRTMPDGQLYATIANGVRNMPAYGAQVPVADRWAIVAYVRALELSQLSMNTEPPK